MTQELDIRDMLSHRSGLEEVGMLWDHTTLSRQELMQRMRFLKPIVGFREGWVYNNLMYLSAGQIIPVITETSWDDFITKRIFVPLGMNRSSTTIEAITNKDNVAIPHYMMQEKIYPAARHNINSIAPAGAINSTIIDMAQWLKMIINKGECDGVRILKEETLNELHSAQAVMKNFYPFQLYGLGLGMFDYQCNQIVFHEGNIDGMSASLAFLPGKKVGIVILTNMHRGGIGKVLMNVIFDKYLNIKNSPDWNETFLAKEKERVAQFLETEKEKARNRRGLTATVRRAFSNYIGTYHSDVYGNVIITEKNNELQCKFLAFDGTLMHVLGDLFAFDPSKQNPLFPSQFYFTFSKDISVLSIEYVDIWMNDMKADFIKK